jgi:C1A family cysteine protease
MSDQNNSNSNSNSNSNFLSTAVKSPDDDRDWVLESIVNYKQQLPVVVDHRKSLQPIRNQGSLGTCAAQTAACMKEYQEHEDVNYDGYFSPMFIYNNRSNQTTEGMYGRDVMAILSNKGVCQENLLKYGNVMSPDNIPVKCNEDAGNFKIKSYARINTLKGLKTALVLYGPCYISFPTYNTNEDMWKPSFKGESSRGGHAMTVVGYNRNSFIIRNSWGSKWGQSGYCYYPFDDFGSHWEVWTTVDADSDNIFKRFKSFKNFCPCSQK